MRLQSIAILCLLPLITLAGPSDELRASQENLRAVITQKLALEEANCARGNHDSCQDALLSNIELNTINSEIALEKLRRTVRSNDLREMIDDVADKLTDLDSAITDIQDKLDE